MTNNDFTFLTSSSHASLRLLIVSAASLEDPLDLSPFPSLLFLHLTLPKLNPEVVKTLINILRSVSPTLEFLELDAHDDNFLADSIIEGQDLLGAIPSGVVALNLVGEHEFPFLSPAYVATKLHDPHFLPSLERLTIGRFYEEEWERDETRAELAEWISSNRPALDLEWRVSGDWSDEEEF